MHSLGGGNPPANALGTQLNPVDPPSKAMCKGARKCSLNPRITQPRELGLS